MTRNYPLPIIRLLSPKPRPTQSPQQSSLLEDMQPRIIAAAHLYCSGLWSKIHITTPAYTKNIAGACTIDRPPYAAHTPPNWLLWRFLPRIWTAGAAGGVYQRRSATIRPLVVAMATSTFFLIVGCHKKKDLHNNTQRKIPEWYNNQNGWEEGRTVENLVGVGVGVYLHIKVNWVWGGVHLAYICQSWHLTSPQHTTINRVQRYIIEGDETIKIELGLVHWLKNRAMRVHQIQTKWLYFCTLPNLQVLDVHSKYKINIQTMKNNQ